MAVDHPVSDHFLNFLGPHQKKKSLQISTNLLIYLVLKNVHSLFGQTLSPSP